MAGNTEGWAVVLDGVASDLLDWEHALNLPFSPWVERYSEPDGHVLYLLRDAAFSSLASSAQLREAALPLIARLNGALAAVENAGRVTLGSALHFRPGGLVDRVVFPATGHLRLTLGKVRLTATGTTGGVAAPPQPSEVQRWSALAYAAEPGNERRADMIADLLDHLGRADNWYDIYKTLELSIMLCGGEEVLFGHAFAKAAGADVIKRNANYHRHAPGKFKKPKNIITIGQAVAGAVVIAIGVLRLIDAGIDPTVQSTS